MSALEALACSTPVLTTPGAGLAGAARGGGIVVEPTVDAVEEALRQAADWSEDERRQRGMKARAVALDTYSPDVLRPQYLSLYRSLAG
jgi:glycosyltransferase involved in cell wall biosynthesis